MYMIYHFKTPDIPQNVGSRFNCNALLCIDSAQYERNGGTAFLDSALEIRNTAIRTGLTLWGFFN